MENTRRGLRYVRGESYRRRRFKKTKIERVLEQLIGRKTEQKKGIFVGILLMNKKYIHTYIYTNIHRGTSILYKEG